MVRLAYKRLDFLSMLRKERDTYTRGDLDSLRVDQDGGTGRLQHPFQHRFAIFNLLKTNEPADEFVAAESCQCVVLADGCLNTLEGGGRHAYVRVIACGVDFGCSRQVHLVRALR